MFHKVLEEIFPSTSAHCLAVVYQNRSQKIFKNTYVRARNDLLSAADTPVQAPTDFTRIQSNQSYLNDLNLLFSVPQLQEEFYRQCKKWQAFSKDDSQLIAMQAFAEVMRRGD